MRLPVVRLTNRSPAYAASQVLYEMATRSVPYNGRAAASVTRGVSDGSLRPDLSIVAGLTPLPIVTLMERCWLLEASARPTAADLVTELSGLLWVARNEEGEDVGRTRSRSPMGLRGDIMERMMHGASALAAGSSPHAKDSDGDAAGASIDGAENPRVSSLNRTYAKSDDGNFTAATSSTRIGARMSASNAAQVGKEEDENEPPNHNATCETLGAADAGGIPSVLWTANVYRTLLPSIGSDRFNSEGMYRIDGNAESFSERGSRRTTRSTSVTEPDREEMPTSSDRQASIGMLDTATLHFRNRLLEEKYHMSTAPLRRGRFGIDCAGHLVIMAGVCLPDFIWFDPDSYAHIAVSTVSFAIILALKVMLLALVYFTSFPLVSFAHPQWSRVLRLTNILCNFLNCLGRCMRDPFFLFCKRFP
jgi:hypothetical protein